MGNRKSEILETLELRISAKFLSAQVFLQHTEQLFTAQGF